MYFTRYGLTQYWYLHTGCWFVVLLGLFTWIKIKRVKKKQRRTMIWRIWQHRNTLHILSIRGSFSSDCAMTTQHCTKCQRYVPSHNFELHRLRCPGKTQADAPSSSIRTQTDPRITELINRGKLCGQIPCSFTDLDVLQAHFPFVPNSQQCRPNAEVL